MKYQLRCSMTARVSQARAFAFFEDPRDLAKITPAWLNFTMVNPEAVMRQGAEIDYVINWLGFPVKWKTLITAYDPPHSFVDEQVRGPYKMWRHRHLFDETPQGLRISDTVDYQLPFGPLGRLAHGMLVSKQLLGIFRFRQAAIVRLLSLDQATFDEVQIKAISRT